MDSYVIKAHKSNYPKPIEFNSKDWLKVGAEDTEYPGWIWVETRDGNEGWAPVEYVELLGEPNRGIARTSYCAQELEVEVGEELQIKNTLCGWYFVTNLRGEIGWVPQDCIQFA